VGVMRVNGWWQGERLATVGRGVTGRGRLSGLTGDGVLEDGGVLAGLEHEPSRALHRCMVVEG